MFEIFPRLRALDGHREGIPVIDFSLVDVGDGDMPDY